MPHLAPRQTVALPRFERVATLVPASLDVAGRSIDVIWTTGAQVRRLGFWDDEPWLEELSLAPGAVDLARLNARGPVLDSHQSYMGVRAILGAVEPDSARIAAGVGIARVRFSQRPDVADLVEDIKAGIIRSLSCGYQIDELVEVRARDRETKQLALYRAEHWTPNELSFVAVGADPGAQTRAGDGPTTHRCSRHKESRDAYRRPARLRDDARRRRADARPRTPESRRPAARRRAPARSAAVPDDQGDASVTQRALKIERKRVQEIREAPRGQSPRDVRRCVHREGRRRSARSRAPSCRSARAYSPPSRVPSSRYGRTA